MSPFVPIMLTLSCATLLNAGIIHGHHSQHPLTGVPDLSDYSKLMYPVYDLIDLGSSTKDQLPPAVVQIHVQKKVEVPKPYPVKVPYPVPHPVHIPQPYPVVQTKIVQVPHPVPVEVPKPYSVGHHEVSHGEGGGEDYSGGFGGSYGQQGGGEEHQENYGGYENLQGGGGFGEGEHQAQGDQSQNYAVAQMHNMLMVNENKQEGEQM